MIKSINLTCFRRHEKLEINLTEGLQVFRGSNEAGKTTVLEGMAYALFGSKALRNTLAEVVTWDHKETELKAEVELEVGGTTYTFKRSKSGAEALVAGKVFATGQTEVSALAAELLGTDANTAAHLMMAGQGGLRGVLSEGPKATSALIEGLSNLDLIEEIIEKAQTNLQLGSTAILNDRLKTAQTTLAATIKPEPVPAIDMAKMQTGLDEAAAKVKVESEAHLAANNLYMAETLKREKLKAIEAETALYETQIADTNKQRMEAHALVKPLPDIDVWQAELAYANNITEVRRGYDAFHKAPVPCFRMAAEGFQPLRKKMDLDLAEVKAAIATNKSTIAALTPQIAADHNCPACGQDTSHLEAVKQKQAKLVADVLVAKDQLAKAEAALPEALENVEEINQMIDVNNTLVKISGGYQGIKADHSTYPVTLIWEGGEVSDALPDVAFITGKINAIKAEIAAINAAFSKTEALGAMVMGLEEKLKLAQDKVVVLGLLPQAEYDVLAFNYDAAISSLAMAEGIYALLKIEMDVAVSQYAEASAAYSQAMLLITNAEEQVAQLNADIETTEFNNGLLKKLRAARPIIANKLWSLVLSTVSTLFTQMRGEQSVVTKGKDGFMVNGRPVESLSGSTQDILGLAIRCALVKTFIPACPFIILDEPSAACDEDRSAALVGFIAAAGFQQVIMVTHSDTSETLATNLVQL
jgi:DNA repair exonuclease SbcCD ATPase subunit